MERHVVTSFLKNGDYYLLLKRSSKVSSYKGKWAAVSGSVEANESIIDTSLREIEEETGISPMDVKLIAEGNAFRIPYTGFDWVVHPLLFISRTLNISLNWENDEASWRKREEMNDLDTVPGLLDALDVLLNNFRQFVI